MKKYKFVKADTKYPDKMDQELKNTINTINNFATQGYEIKKIIPLIDDTILLFILEIDIPSGTLILENS